MNRPRYGFNFQWMYVWEEGKRPEPADLPALDFMADLGLDFVRLPTDYNFWTPDFDYLNPDESSLGPIDDYLAACRERGLHMSLNMHRAPGYCINRNERERDNLWTDEVAQEGFVHQWQIFARRYRDVPATALSFDLVNEPPGIGQYGLTRDGHAALMRRTVAAIRSIHPDRPIIIDGLGGGNIALPELADLDVVHSGRGYQPMAVSHYRAGWWSGSRDLPEPVYPGTRFDDRIWDKEALRRHYAPWQEVEKMGAWIYIGEFGCYNRTPNDVALRWLSDLMSLFREFGWGYALWNFRGPFGIVEHGRPGARYEERHGLQVDSDLLEIFLKNRVAGPNAQ
jgi:aryl-phospho-beta-D-glucosidase BglC (GH1 family)